MQCNHGLGHDGRTTRNPELAILNVKATRPDDPQRAESAGSGLASTLLSHDIRAALSDVLGGLSLIGTDGLTADDRVQFERVEAASRALKTLLEDALARSEARGRAITTRQRIETGTFLDGLRQRWTGRAAALGARFELRVQGNPPAVIASDPVALDRVLANILSNAIKYAPDGTVTLTVGLDGDAGLNWVVTDDGPGLSPAALAALYEYEGRPSDSGQPGSGMGLFIAAELARALGGRLAVSNAKVGAVAELHLPRSAWNDPGHVAEPGPHRPERQIDLQGLRVLLAEDNPTNQMVAGQMLAALNARCTLASDGQEAFGQLRDNDFDLALIDIEMPAMSGLEVMQSVRALGGPRGRIPMVALTAYVMKEHRDRILAAGADGIIAKPVSGIDELGEAVRAHVGKTAKGQPPREVQADVAAAAKRFDPATLHRLLDSVGQDIRDELFDKLDDDLAAVERGLGAAGGARPDWMAIRGHTHVLTSVAGVVGDAGLQARATDLNRLAHAEDAECAGPKLVECIDRVAGLRSAIGEERRRGGAAA